MGLGVLGFDGRVGGVFIGADDSLLERKIGELRPSLFNQVLETVRTKLLIDI